MNIERSKIAYIDILTFENKVWFDIVYFDR